MPGLYINPTREDARLSAEEMLALQFYDWEVRGRGWKIWDNPVTLEPPFRPFYHFLPADFFLVEDTGRHQTILSGLVRGAARLLLGSKRQRERGEWEISEPPPPYTEGSAGEQFELAVALPANLHVGHEAMQRFLIALSHCQHPIGLELIGLESGVAVQLVCRERDRLQLRQQLSAYFPEAVVTERQHFLFNQWEAVGKDALVVDFGLSHEFVMPLRTYGGFDPDPWISLAAALADVRREELGVLQVLFQPCEHPWAESIFRAVTDLEGKPFFRAAPELVGQAKQKVSRPLYAAMVRVMAKGGSEERTWRIAQGIGASLAQFKGPGTNELVPLTNDEYPDGIYHELDFVSRISHRCGMILNSEELLSLVHLPSASIRTLRLKRQLERTKGAPEVARGQATILGENEHESQTVTVSLAEGQRVRHMHVIGASGTGKSTFLLNLISQDMEQGHGLAVLDPHGDLIDAILERVPEGREQDVILVDPSDERFPVGFNILSAHSEVEKHLLSSDLVAVFKRLSTSWGDQMTSVLGNAILAFLESDQGGTLADLRRFLIEKEFRQSFLKSVRDSEIVYYWQKEFPLLQGRPQAPLLTRLDAFLRPKLIRHMVAQQENKLDFGEIMNGGKIFLAKLAQGGIGEENAFLLGSLMVSKFQQLAISRQEQREAERRPFFLYIDEFQNFITPSMTQILSGARKYRLGLILAHQELRQMGAGSSEIASAVLANSYTRVCFRLGDDDARKLADGFVSFAAKDLQNLGTGEAIARVERAEFDFNLRTLPLPLIDAEQARLRQERLTNLSRQKYAVPREVVEAEIAKASTPGEVPRTEEKTGKEKGPKVSEASPQTEAVIVPIPSVGTGTPALDPKLATTPASNDAPPSYQEALRERDQRPRKSEDEEGRSAPPAKERLMVPAEPPPLGRGGKEHQYFQNLIKQWAHGMGWRAVIERPILDGAGSVDVALEKGDRSIACEISITTGVEQELGNIEKCLIAGYQHIAVVSTDAKHLHRIAEAAGKKFNSQQSLKISFHTPDDLFAFIEKLDAELGSTETMTKGMKVKVKFKTGGTNGTSERMKTLSETVARSVQNKRGKS